jgi:hypothetical protein
MTVCCPRTTDSQLKRIISTNCCIHTVVPPDDGPRYARNMQRLTKYTKNKLCIKLVFLYTVISRCTANKTQKSQISNCGKLHTLFCKAYLSCKNQFFTLNVYFIQFGNRLTSKLTSLTYFRHVDCTCRYCTYNCRPARAELFTVANKSGNCLSLWLYFAKCSLCRKTLQMQHEDFSGICIYVIYKCLVC